MDKGETDSDLTPMQLNSLERQLMEVLHELHMKRVCICDLLVYAKICNEMKYWAFFLVRLQNFCYQNFYIHHCL